MIKLSKKHITIFCLVCLCMATMWVMVSGVEDTPTPPTPTPPTSLSLRPSYGQFNWENIFLEVEWSKYAPNPTDLPFECVKVTYMATEKGLNDVSQLCYEAAGEAILEERFTRKELMKLKELPEELEELLEETKISTRVVYAEETDFKEPQTKNLIATVTVYEIPKVEGAKAVYDAWYSGTSEFEAVNFIDIGEEGFYSYRGECTNLIFRVDRFLILVFGKAGVYDMAEITERNIKRVEPIPKVTPIATPTPPPISVQTGSDIIPEATPTPKTPRFDVIFAIIGLLTIAYFKRRRKNERK